MTFSSDPRKPPTAARVAQAFRARNVDPEGDVLDTDAAVQIWAESAKRANGVDPRRIAQAQGPRQTALGEISFAEKGDMTVSDQVFYVWRNGSCAAIRSAAALPLLPPRWGRVGAIAAPAPAARTTAGQQRPAGWSLPVGCVGAGDDMPAGEEHGRAQRPRPERFPLRCARGNRSSLLFWRIFRVAKRFRLA